MKRSTFLLFAILLCATYIIGQSNITFTVTDVPTTEDQKVGIRGNLHPLSWSKSTPLVENNGVYSVSLNFDISQEKLEFKFVLYTTDENPTWEKIQNRTIEAKEIENIISENKWNQKQIIDIYTLQPISSELLQKDFELIRAMVLDVHPGTLRYNTKEEINAALLELKTTFNQPQTYQDAYLAISKLTAQLKCDHTKAGFNNQGEIINSIIHYQKDKIPFTFKWIDDEMIVTHNASENSTLVRGTKVLSINNIAVLDIRKKMFAYIGADGNTNKNRIYKTEVDGYDFRRNAFDIFYPLLYPIEDGQLQLTIQQVGADEIEEITVHTLTRKRRFATLTERYEHFPKSRDDMWKFEIKDNHVAILTLNSFGLYGWKAMTIDYKYFLADAFKKIHEAKIENLIIDIRENNGGNDEMAKELFLYLSEWDYNYDREGRTRYVSFPNSLKPFIRTWGDDPWYYKLKPKNPNPINGYYSFKESYDQEASKSDKNVFKGKTHMIIGSANTSLAFYTAARFTMQNIGTTIGTETGGNLNDINGGQILFLNLPHSKIEIDFPIMGAFTIPEQPDQGIKPDIEVNYSRQDIVSNIDLELIRLLKMINK